MDPLRVEGAVASPQAFDADQLGGLDGQVGDISSLVRGRTGTAVRFSSLMDAVHPAADVRYATLESADGSFAASVALEALAEALVVYRKDGVPLTVEEGGPFRLLIPDAAVCRSGGADRCAAVKFLGRITLSPHPGRDTRDVT